MENNSFITFIHEHYDEDPLSLRLKYHGKNTGFDTDLAITQIKCRHQTADKLPFFIQYKNFLFPDESIAEQSTNQYIALFHAHLIGNNQSVCDMTSGLGIDTLTEALYSNHVTAIEVDKRRAEILTHNVETIGLNNITVINEDSVKWIDKTPQKFDWIFIDPARRDQNNQRSFLLEDSDPDVTLLIPTLLKKADNILIKGSPLLDITRTLNQLPNLKNLYIVSLNNEVKEVSIHISNQCEENTSQVIRVVDLAKSNNFPDEMKINYDMTIDLSGMDRLDKTMSIPSPAHYLYEVGAGFRKVQSDSWIAALYSDIYSLDKNSHILYSDVLYPDFPGRISVIEKDITDINKKQLKDIPARIITESYYPLTPEKIRNKYKIPESKEKTLVFLNNPKQILLVSPVDTGSMNSKTDI